MLSELKCSMISLFSQYLCTNVILSPTYTLKTKIKNKSPSKYFSESCVWNIVDLIFIWKVLVWRWITYQILSQIFSCTDCLLSWSKDVMPCLYSLYNILLSWWYLHYTLPIATLMWKGEVRNTIINTKGKTVLPLFSICNKHTGVTWLL